MEQDGGLWTNILFGLSTLGASGWAVYKTWQNNKLTSANNDAGVAIANGQQEVFNMLTSRLETVEKEVQGLRAELSIERQHSRKLEIHIYKLEDTMRKNGIEPPLFDGDK